MPIRTLFGACIIEVMMNASEKPDQPISFGYKCSWLAIKSEHPLDVVAALALRHVRLANWKSGIEAAYAGEVFISPPLDGWILAVSRNFPWPGGAQFGDPCTPFLRPLAHLFPEVQFLATHRVVETHAWARLVNGTILRQYAYSGESGEILWNVGTPTDEEVALLLKQEDRLRAFWGPEDVDAIVTGDEPFLMPSESDVMRMAAVWSIDPSQLRDRNLGLSVGHVGAFDQNRLLAWTG